MKRVLYIEDSITLVKIVKTFLEDNGYNVTTVDNYEDAIKLIDENDYDVIVSDIILRGINKTGYDIVKYFRKNKSEETPVIVTSTRGGRGVVVASKMSGANHFLQKPFTPEDLLKIIEEEINK